MNQRAARRLLAHALVWGTFVLAVAIHLIALPYGVVFPNLYAVPLLGAALVWPPRAVIAFLALTVIAIGVSFLAVGAPTTLERVRLVGLVLIGGLTIQTARLRVAAEAAGRAR